MSSKTWFYRNFICAGIFVLFTSFQPSLPEEGYPCQSLCSASSKNGLVLRDRADRAGRALDLILYGHTVQVLEHTGRYETIEVRGEWLKVKYLEKTGFVFGGFLRPSEVEIAPSEFDPSHSKFSGGMGCTGSTFSEYALTLEFQPGTVVYTLDSAGSNDCRLIPGAVEKPYNGSTHVIQRGTWSRTGRTITVDLGPGTLTQTCVDGYQGGKETSVPPIQHTFYLVHCEDRSGQKGFQSASYSLISPTMTEKLIWAKITDR